MIVTLVFLGGIAVALRLVQLQVVEHSRLAARGTRQKSYVEVLPAPPGDLLDRDGRVLATSIVARSLFVVPENIADPWPCAQRLARALHLDPDRLSDRLQQPDKKFAWVKRRLTPEDERAVRAPPSARGHWGFREEYIRRYPQGNLAAHVLGLRDVDGTCRGGLEQSLEVVLRGEAGRRTLYRDARGRVIDVPDDTEVPPQPGRSVATTLDSVIQLYAERELDRVVEEWKPQGACALVQESRQRRNPGDGVATRIRSESSRRRFRRRLEESGRRLDLRARFDVQTVRGRRCHRSRTGPSRRGDRLRRRRNASGEPRVS